MSGHSTYIKLPPKNFLFGKGLACLPFMIGSTERWKGVNT